MPAPPIGGCHSSTWIDEYEGGGTMTGTTTAVTRVQWSRQGPEAIEASFGRVTTDDPSNYRSRGVRWTFGDVVVSDTIQSP